MTCALLRLSRHISPAATARTPQTRPAPQTGLSRQPAAPAMMASNSAASPPNGGEHQAGNFGHPRWLPFHIPAQSESFPSGGGHHQPVRDK